MSESGSVVAGSTASPFAPPFTLAESAPDPVAHVSGQGTLQTLDPDRAGGAQRFGLPLPGLPLQRQLCVGTKEQ